jgi:hypothetical protein
MSRDLTQKQRTAMAAAEAARTAGLTLSAYCIAQGLKVREVYDAIAALRRSGVLPRAEKSRRRKSEFVAVRVVKTQQPSPGMTPPGAGMVCRLVHASGLLIECGEWPPAAWLLSLTSGLRDAAS